jgi:hypothetical protein
MFFTRASSPLVRSGILGEMDETGKSAYIWTHKRFEIGYNGDRIVDVNLTSEAKVHLQPNMKIPFTYEVTWKPSTIVFPKRFDKYLDPGFFQHKVRSSPIDRRQCPRLDPLVLHLQFVHDGSLSRRTGQHDSSENTEKGLCKIRQR